MANWVQLTKNQAKTHRLYGAGGWLIVFYILFVLNTLAGLGHASNAMYKYYGGLPAEKGYTPFTFVTSDISVFGLQILAWGQLALYASLIYLAITKNRNFRRAANIMLVTLVIVKPMILTATWNYQDLINFPFYLLFVAICLIYINISKRVRVTYDWKVKSTDDIPNKDSDGLVKDKPKDLYERKEPTF